MVSENKNNSTINSIIREIDEIDLVHNETTHLFQKFKTISDKMLKDHLKLLLLHLRAHFKEEERLMKILGYEDFNSHLEEHERFIERLSALYDKVEFENNLLNLRKGIAEDYLGLLNIHIQTHDKKMIRYLKESLSTPAAS